MQAGQHRPGLGIVSAADIRLKLQGTHWLASVRLHSELPAGCVWSRNGDRLNFRGVEAPTRAQLAEVLKEVLQEPNTPEELEKAGKYQLEHAKNILRPDFLLRTRR